MKMAIAKHSLFQGRTKGGTNIKRKKIAIYAIAKFKNGDKQLMSEQDVNEHIYN